MSIADKLSEISSNTTRVYEAGVAAGRAPVWRLVYSGNLLESPNCTIGDDGDEEEWGDPEIGSVTTWKMIYLNFNLSDSNPDDTTPFSGFIGQSGMFRLRISLPVPGEITEVDGYPVNDFSCYQFYWIDGYKWVASSNNMSATLHVESMLNQMADNYDTGEQFIATDTDDVIFSPYPWSSISISTGIYLKKDPKNGYTFPENWHCEIYKREDIVIK